MAATSPARLVVDRYACAGHGLCYATAPDLLGADDMGDPVVLLDPIPGALLETARTATSVCPERALSLAGAALPDSEELSR